MGYCRYAGTSSQLGHDRFLGWGQIRGRWGGSVVLADRMKETCNIWIKVNNCASNGWFTHISTFATFTIISLNWLCSHASADRSIIARAALSNSSYLTYKKTNSDHKCACSAALITLGMLMRETNNFRCSITKKSIRLAPTEIKTTYIFLACICYTKLRAP